MGGRSYLCVVVVKNPIGAHQTLREIDLSHRPFVVSGPCSAESREQTLASAKGLAAVGGVDLFRAGIWKPRTRPNSFEGKGVQALEWLSEVRAVTGLPVATEVATPQHVEACLQANVDVLWIGARTTVSPFAVQEIAESLKGTQMPTMVKNPMHADLKLWMGAIERMRNQTGGSVWAIHRGFTSYGLKDYRNAPMWEIPIGLRAAMPEVPLLCDPSHISGNRDLIQFVAQKAMDLGMHGLMIESHCNPDSALSDAQQQLTPEAFAAVMNQLTIRESQADSEQRFGLEGMRLQMDSMDEQLVELLASRMRLARDIGQFKKANGMTILQLERWREVFETRGDWAGRVGLGQDFISKILEQLHKESIRVQNDEMSRK